MIKIILKILFIVLILACIAISISNFTDRTTRATMIEEQLYYWDFGWAILYRCSGPGQGCYTVYPSN